MLPANPPAMRANPRNKNSLAFQATLSELENPPSDIRRCLSIRLTMIIPKVLKRGDSQSGKATLTGTVSKGASAGGPARAERRHASKKNHQPMVNYCYRHVIDKIDSVSASFALRQVLGCILSCMTRAISVTRTKAPLV